MATMVRKQECIEPRQEMLLKRLSRARGVSEAELIRQAIGRHIGHGHLHTIPPDPGAWEAACQLMLKLRAGSPEAAGAHLATRGPL
jgi:hypothetical protein